MTETKTNPGYYTLRSLVLQSVVGNRSDFFDAAALDISNMVPSISISTSIDQSAIMGSFRVHDSLGVLEKFPLRGEERASIVVIDSLENEVIFDVFLYKIDEVSVSDENDVVYYTVHFLSYQGFQSGKYEIIKAFREKTITDIVTEIFNEYYLPRREARPSDFGANPNDRVSESSNKNIIIYPGSDGLVRCTIPRLKPDEAMAFLSKRAYSELSPSNSYRFFENLRSYYFTTDEALYDTANQRNQIFQFTYVANIQKNQEGFEAHMNNLSSLSNAKRVNTVDDMYSGTYRNKIFTLDILKRTVNLNDPGYSYLENKGRYFGTESQNVEDRHTQEFADEYLNENIQKKFLLVKNYTDEDTNSDAALYGNLSLDMIASNRLAFRKHIESILLTASGPGRLDITAGDVIDLYVPEINVDEPKRNPQLSGKYIVKSVVYEMNMDTMTNKYLLMKREWAVTAGETSLGLLDL